MRKPWTWVVFFLTLVFLVGSCQPIINRPPYSPSSPSPNDNASDVPIDTVLSWNASDPDGDPLTFDVYFGASSNPPLVAQNLTESRYDPGTLEFSTTYYWKVVVKDDHGHTTQGPIWRFTTMEETIPEIQWQKTLGGSDNDGAYSIIQTQDGGFVVAGWTSSNDGNVSGNHGNSDMWIVKLNEYGNIVWKKTLGGSNIDGAFSIIQTRDGGFVVAGGTESNDGDVPENHGNADMWIIKLNEYGNIVWQKTLGGSDNDGAWSIIQTQDGGFVAAGKTKSNDEDVSGNHGNIDMWIVKLGW